jgi:hypothetical protein
MSKLSLKQIERKHLPYGKFKFIVLLKRESRRIWRCSSNASMVEQMRGFLRTTINGSFKLVHEYNYKGRRVYTHLYLTEPMDLAMLKLVHGDRLFKIYKVKLAQPHESPLGDDQTES